LAEAAAERGSARASFVGYKVLQSNPTRLDDAEMKDQTPKLKVSPWTSGCQIFCHEIIVMSPIWQHYCYLVQTLVIKPGAAFLFTVRLETLGHL